MFGHRGITTGGGALQDAAAYETNDAGSSWTAVQVPFPELAANFVYPDRGWMIGAGPGGDTERRSIFFRTMPARPGARWTDHHRSSAIN